MATYKLISRSAQVTDEGLRRTVVRKVKGYTDEYLLLADTNLPRRGVFDTAHPNSVCVDVSADYIAGSIDVWEHTAVFLDVVFVPPGGTPQNYYGIPNVQSTIEAIRIYRANPTLPSGNNIDTPDPTLDIGGNGQDQGGEPIDRPISVERLTIRQRVSTVQWSVFDAIKRKRNSDTFFTRPARKVLYMGYSHGDPDGDGFTVLTHEFAVDSDFHLRQKARTSGDGEVVRLAQGETPPANRILKPGQAYSVFWEQPFPITTSFVPVFGGGP